MSVITQIGAAFSRQEALSRNVGWITEAEGEELANKTVAIAGMGGVGGKHLLTLTRMGIGQFHLADFDVFELANFNRQAGADVSTIGRRKLDVMADRAKRICPDLNLNLFEHGLRQDNMDAFLEGVDVFVDGLDFFALDIRRKVFRRCWQKGIPIVTAAPLGMGTSMIVFHQGGMSPDDYFGWADCSDQKALVRFLVGLAPRLFQTGYIADHTRVDFARGKGPSTPMGCDLSAGALGTQVLKLLVNRGEVAAAPTVVQFDAFRLKYARTRRAGGWRHPLNRLACWIIEKRFGAVQPALMCEPPVPTPLREVN